MNKRSVLAPVKKPVEQAEIPQPERRDLDDKEIFALPKNEPTPSSQVKGIKENKEVLPQTASNTEIQEPIIQTQPVKQKKQRDYSHLQKAREKSLEARRRKAEEKKQLQSDVDAYKEKLEFERLSKKYGKTSISQNEVPMTPEPQRKVAPQPEQKVENYVVPEQKKPQPVPSNVASVNPHHDMSGSIIDYDRLIGGVADRLSQQNSYFTQLEKDIRADERKKAEATYQEQLKSWEKQQHRQYQREQAYGAMSQSYKRNQVFDRSAKLRDMYTQRYKNNWYSNY